VSRCLYCDSVLYFFRSFHNNSAATSPLQKACFPQPKQELLLSQKATIQRATVQHACTIKWRGFISYTYLSPYMLWRKGVGVEKLLKFHAWLRNLPRSGTRKARAHQALPGKEGEGGGVRQPPDRSPCLWLPSLQGSQGLAPPRPPADRPHTTPPTAPSCRKADRSSRFPLSAHSSSCFFMLAWTKLSIRRPVPETCRGWRSLKPLVFSCPKMRA